MAKFNFIQIADPQVGMFARVSGMEGVDQERKNLETALRQFQKIDPAFVVVCGDMVDTAGDDDQI